MKGVHPCTPSRRFYLVSMVPKYPVRSSPLEPFLLWDAEQQYLVIDIRHDQHLLLVRGDEGLGRDEVRQGHGCDVRQGFCILGYGEYLDVLAALAQDIEQAPGGIGKELHDLLHLSDTCLP